MLENPKLPLSLIVNAEVNFFNLGRYKLKYFNTATPIATLG